MGTGPPFTVWPHPIMVYYRIVRSPDGRLNLVRDERVQFAHAKRIVVNPHSRWSEDGDKVLVAMSKNPTFVDGVNVFSVSMGATREGTVFTGVYALHWGHTITASWIDHTWYSEIFSDSSPPPEVQLKLRGAALRVVLGGVPPSLKDALMEEARHMHRMDGDGMRFWMDKIKWATLDEGRKRFPARG